MSGGDRQEGQGPGGRAVVKFISEKFEIVTSVDGQSDREPGAKLVKSQRGDRFIS